MLFRNFIMVMSCFIYSQSLFSQIDKEFESNRDRYFFGGNMGLMFGTITNINVSPKAGYYITRRMALGVGISYQYYKSTQYNLVETNIYGGSIFARHFLFPNLSEYFPIREGISLFGQFEYNGLNLETKYFSNGISTINQGERIWSHNYLTGGGIMQKSGRRSAFYVMVLFLLSDIENTPFENPEIRFGIIF